jgi:hypothetical protein
MDSSGFIDSKHEIEFEYLIIYGPDFAINLVHVGVIDSSISWSESKILITNGVAELYGI